MLSFVFLSGCNSGTRKEEAGSVKTDENKRLTDTAHYRKLGDSIVKITFDTLRNALTSTIAEKGFSEAISFCNVNAYPITAWYAKEGVTIRRTSARFRNPANSPDSLEAIWLQNFAVPGTGTAVVPEGGRIHYFKPILLQAMCKNCHGDPSSDIRPETLAEIRKRYPEDKATGYQEGEMRGMWHLVFTGKQ